MNGETNRNSTAQVQWAPGITPDAVRNQLSRILASGAFTGSQRMARFLAFAVEETLNGNASDLKEIVIGSKVFDRPVTYDPRLDPIVRVEARRLRAKLGAYYDGHGKEDGILIEFPKGRYSPVFLLQAGAKSGQRENTCIEEGTIAVLPFTNLDPDGGSDYFSDGLSEELIHALMRIPNLRVVAWNSAAQLRGRQQDIGAIRQRLDVAHSLHGSIRRTEQRLRISAYLIDTSNGHYVWSETYDRQLSDVFVIQREIATSIATALKLRFWKAEDVPPTIQSDRDLECYQMCLKGRFHARERTAEGFKRSLACFERAIRIDSASASSFAGLAETYALMAEYGFADGGATGKARAAVEKALELDPRSAEAHATLGLILAVYDWQWARAGRSFERAVELNPGYATAHHWYAIDYLAMLGRFSQAETQINIAVKLDPLSSIVLLGPPYLEFLARKFDASIEGFQRLIEIDPSFYKAYTAIGRAYLHKGMYGEAIAMLETGRSLAGDIPSILGALGQAQGLAGNFEAARQLLAQLHELAAAHPVPFSSFAYIHLGLGEKDAALDWLERGVSSHQSSMAGLKVHPAYDALRQELRFQQLLHRIGLADDILP